MNRIYRSAIRDLWFHRTRTVVLVLAIVVLTAFPIAFLDLPYNLGNVIDAEEEEYHLAHLNIFFESPVPRNTSQLVDDLLVDYGFEEDQFIVEGRTHLTSKIKASGNGDLLENSWISTEIISLAGPRSPQVNNVLLSSGRFPITDQETVVLRSLGEADGLALGDNVTIYSFSGPKSFTITGFVDAIEYSSFNLSQSGLLMITEDGMIRLLEWPGELFITSIPVYFYKDPELDDLVDIADYLEKGLNDDPNLPPIGLIWFVRNTSYRKGLQDALELTSDYMFIASMFIFLVAGVIIYVVMNRYINEQKTIIGALYSYGVKRRSITFSYFLRIFIVSLIGVAIGLWVARQLIIILVDDLANSWGLITPQYEFSEQSLQFTLSSSVIVTYLSTFIAVSNLFRLTPYEAMRGKTKELGSRGLIFMIVPFLPFKTFRNSVKNLTRNRTRAILTLVAFTLAISFAWSLIYTNASLGYTIATYYDEEVNFDLEITIGYENAFNFTLLDSVKHMEGISETEIYINSLVQYVDHRENLSFLMGIQHNTTMFNLDENRILEGRWFKENSTEVVISRYVAAQYGFERGDKLEFKLFDVQFNTTVVGIANEMVSSISILMDVDYIGKTLNTLPAITGLQDKTMFNKILAKVTTEADPEDIQNQINEDHPEIISAFTKNHFERRFTSLANSQSGIILLMANLGLIVGFVSILTTLLIAIVEREREMALLQVFGYSKVTLVIQLLVEGLILGGLSLLASFFLSKYLTTELWQPIVNNSLFQLKPIFDIHIDLQLYEFTILATVTSVFFGFFNATKRRIVEVLHDE